MQVLSIFRFSINIGKIGYYKNMSIEIYDLSKLKFKRIFIIIIRGKKLSLLELQKTNFKIKKISNKKPIKT